MSEDELLDMDYFLNEDDPFDDGFGEEGFYIFWSSHRFIVMSRHTLFEYTFDKRVFFFAPLKIGISYKVKRKGLSANADFGPLIEKKETIP